MSAKKVPFSQKGVDQLPKDKPVLYRIQPESGNLNYAGVAQRGRVTG
jgi:hypothetical protein